MEDFKRQELSAPVAEMQPQQERERPRENIFPGSKKCNKEIGSGFRFKQGEK